MISCARLRFSGEKEKGIWSRDFSTTVFFSTCFTYFGVIVVGVAMLRKNSEVREWREQTDICALTTNKASDRREAEEHINLPYVDEDGLAATLATLRTANMTSWPLWTSTASNSSVTTKVYPASPDIDTLRSARQSQPSVQ